MNVNLNNKIIKIRKSVNKYKKLEEADKIDNAIKIKKDLRNCKKIITSYLELIDNANFDNLSDNNISDNEILDSPSNDPSVSESVDKTKFKYVMDQIRKIKETLDNKDITIDDKISLYLDLVKYTNLAKSYLNGKKELTMTYL